MPPRPALKVKQSRPLSQVYIGKGASPSLQDLSQSASTYASLIEGTPPGLPDLPEPPSPSSSVGSVKSGLPSPPATNSTGSGSTGDPATIAIRGRPLSHHSNSSASTDTYHAVATPVKRSSVGTSSRSSSRLGNVQMDDAGAEGDFDDDYDKENDNDNESNLDGDDTARLDRLLANSKADRDNPKSSSENVLALQRVKSLAQRNRMALDKLEKLRSPSPARPSTPNSLASSTSSRYSNPPKQVRAHEPIMSGSETERESTRHSNTNSTHSSHSSSYIRSASSSHHRSPSLSTSYLSTTPPPPATPHHRKRQISAPDSPSKARLIAAAAASAASSSNLTRSPSNRRRNRASLASVSQFQLTDFEEEEDPNDDIGQKTATGTARGHTRERTLNERDLIIQSALAAAASSRRSPLGNRRRSALPKEFRSDLADESPSPNPTGAGRWHDTRRDSPERDERRESWKHNVEPITPFRATSNANGGGRPSTLRDVRRSGGPNPQWSSEDFRAPATLRDRADRPYNNSLSNEDGDLKRERRQSLRGGSAESALMWSPGGRSLLGEGLRAAGLSRRKDDESRGGQSSAGGMPSAGSVADTFRERERRVDWSPQDVLDDGRRRVFSEREREKQPMRAATSMAHYQYLDRDEPSPREREGGRELGLRGHRSTYSLATRDTESPLSKRDLDPSGPRRERESQTLDRAGSSMSRYNTTSMPPHTPSHILDRVSTASPFGSRRHNNPLNSSTSSQTQSEHTRLMLESLSMFETQLGKLPQLSTTSSAGTGASQAELTRNAQNAVLAAERLSGLLKSGSTRALDAQVDAEVESAPRDAKSEAEIWGKVASDYREGSRAADELVRGLTALLLGMGRVVRDFSATSGASEFGSPSSHGRHASLGEDVTERRLVVTPDSGLVDGHSGSAGTSGRRSVASRHSWEPSPRDREREREDALRRLAGGPVASRSESVLARASPATFQKMREREYLETPSHQSKAAARNSVPGATGSGSGSGASGSTRKLFTPREQREQLLDAKAAAAAERGGSGGSGGGVIRGTNMATLDSQETIHVQRYEPSPTPASRTRATPPERERERTRTLTPLSIPKPLPTLPSEARRQTSTLVRPLTANNEKTSTTNPRDRDRRRAGTMRGAERPSFPSITTPSNATTAVTPHTVSNTPHRTAFPSLQRTDSEKSTRSQVTFSRPTTASVSATLTDLHERHRTISNVSASAEPSGSLLPESSQSRPRVAAGVTSGSETERDVRRKTLGARMARMSLDGPGPAEKEDDERPSQNSTVHAADRSAASTILQQPGGGPGRRERRRTVTDIWPRE